MGRLTTHVLDTATGRPASGLKVELFGDDGALLAAGVTNADGRLDRPLLSDDAFAAGVYELHFHVGAYLRDSGVTLPEPPFLEMIPIRFGVGDRNAHYHVPLLLSPYGYATYRGS